jgi:type IV pilus assembly protein PilQ
MKYTCLVFNLKFIFLFAICISFANIINGQNRFETIEAGLKKLTVVMPGLEQKVDLSVNGASIQEFLRGIAVSNNLNISVDAALNVSIVNNFSQVTVSNVLLFLCQKYDLDIRFFGNIISVTKYTFYKKPIIEYDSEKNLLTLDLKEDSLAKVVKEITRLSNKNVILSPDIKGKMVSGYIQKMPFDNAIDKMALSNDLKLAQTEDNFYVLKSSDIKPTTNQPNNPSGNYNYKSSPTFNFKVDSSQKITLFAVNIPIADIIAQISKALNTDYYIYSDIKENATLNVKQLSYDELLGYLFNGTQYTFSIDNGIYLIGDRQIEGIRTTRVIKLQHRTVDKIIEFIPSELKKNIEVKEFAELNSLVACGSLPVINELDLYIKEIDKTVPLVLIEVLITEQNSNYTISTGINAGTGTKPTSTQTVFPNVDYTLDATAVNNLINGINGFGLIKLGNFTPNFYLTIKAMESQGYLKVLSTPKLATLNGHEAKMSIGKTAYYLEETNNVYGSQIPQNVVTKQYKDVKADLSVTINPIVSGDDDITLNISVEQSDFTDKIAENAPPNQVTRSFTSLIRVKNDEVVLLGGLESQSQGDSGSGTPLLSRIPVIKWLFSSRQKTKSKSKLNIFIKSTILY